MISQHKCACKSVWAINYLVNPSASDSLLAGLIGTVLFVTLFVWCRICLVQMASGLLVEYLPVLVFLGLAFAISLVLLIAPFVLVFKNPYRSKISTYECGFPPISESRVPFDARFYLVAILFIILDIEAAFIFPWAVVFLDLGWFAFWSMILFLLVLAIGFVYEYKKGALEWD